MATDHQQQTERRFVRSDDPNLSAEANAALTEELQQAIGAKHVSMPADAPDPATAERSGDSVAKATVVSMRPLFIVTLFAALTVGAVIALSTGSWWALVIAVGVHALGTMVVAAGAIQSLRTQDVEDQSEPCEGEAELEPRAWGSGGVVGLRRLQSRAATVTRRARRSTES
jgi:hypothetical protein